MLSFCSLATILGTPIAHHSVKLKYSEWLDVCGHPVVNAPLFGK